MGEGVGGHVAYGLLIPLFLSPEGEHEKVKNAVFNMYCLKYSEHRLQLLQRYYSSFDGQLSLDLALILFLPRRLCPSTVLMYV